MGETTNQPVEGTFTGTGAGPPFTARAGFNMSLSGFGTATIALERSFDAGVTWKVVESFSADTERRVDDPELNVFYRFNATAHSSGTIVFRLSS